MRAETLLPLGKLDPGLAKPEQALDYASIGNDARLAERLGYHALLMEETKDDPFQVLAVASQASEQIKLGTSVAIAFARSPFVTAQAAWTLQNLSGGRFELGLGSQVRGHIRRRFGQTWKPPGPWMRDYISTIRALWQAWQTESTFEIENAHYQLNLNVPLFTPAPIAHPHIPILVAAVNPYMAGVAAEVADGVRLHPVCSARYIREVIQPVIADKAAGKPHFEICLKPLLVTAMDEATLRVRQEVARQRLAFYCATPAYAGAFALYGLEDLAAELATLSKRGAWAQMAAKISDELLNEWVVIATVDQLADAIRDRYGNLVSRIEVGMPAAAAHEQEALAEAIRTLDSY